MPGDGSSEPSRVLWQLLLPQTEPHWDGVGFCWPPWAAGGWGWEYSRLTRRTRTCGVADSSPGVGHPEGRERRCAWLHACELAGSPTRHSPGSCHVLGQLGLVQPVTSRAFRVVLAGGGPDPATSVLRRRKHLRAAAESPDQWPPAAAGSATALGSIHRWDQPWGRHRAMRLGG